MTAIQSEPIRQFKADPVRIAYELDDGPGQYRIGLLALSNDLATERDFINMRPCDDIALFVSRIPNDDVCSVESLRVMEPELTNATAQLIPGIASRCDCLQLHFWYGSIGI